ncbi:MAG TPA: manganese efflux pump [Syntrophomonadaceae bacterium]|jgi:putative Mn2+ efflux pump MntP|nr:manganese efflux pump [Syntrophomonadaceae bacterium]
MTNQIITIVMVAIALGVDAMSLSMGMGLRGVSRSYERRFSFMVGVFHVLMPLIGLNLGIVAGKFLGIWAGRVGALVLILIGLDMLYEASRNIKLQSVSFAKAGEIIDEPPAGGSWWDMIILSTTVSIDALTVGFSLGTLQMPILYTVFIMGLTAALMTYIGFRGGRLLGRLVGNYAEMIGGLVLIVLALKLFFYS